MQKICVYLVISLIFLPSCLNRKSTSEKTVKVPGDKKNSSSHERRNLFLDGDDVQEFVFEEDAQEDTFAPNFMKDDSSVTLVDFDQEKSQTSSHRASQSKYGFKSIYFDYDRFSINPSQKVVLEQSLDAVKKAINAGETVVIEGHSCNSAGSAVYNMLLSEKRAQSVARYLAENGIPVADKVKIVGRGSEMCIVPLGDKDQQAPNRRVEFYTV